VPEQEAYFAGTRGAHAAPAPAVPAVPAAARAGETIEQKYLRETRNAVTFIAVVVGIVAALSLIAAIVVGTQLAKVNRQLGNLNGSVSSSNCYSQGGTDMSC